MPVPRRPEFQLRAALSCRALPAPRTPSRTASRKGGPDGKERQPTAATALRTRDGPNYLRHRRPVHTGGAWICRRYTPTSRVRRDMRRGLLPRDPSFRLGETGPTYAVLKDPALPSSPFRGALRAYSCRSRQVLVHLVTRGTCSTCASSCREEYAPSSRSAVGVLRAPRCCTYRLARSTATLDFAPVRLGAVLASVKSYQVVPDEKGLVPWRTNDCAVRSWTQA